MELFPAAKWWRVAFVAAIGSFLLTRALMLSAFPIFNDEAIYLQYSQAIHDDWEKNRFISMNGIYADWKPPLQYWLAAPLITLRERSALGGPRSRCGDVVPRFVGRLFVRAGTFRRTGGSGGGVAFCALPHGALP